VDCDPGNCRDVLEGLEAGGCADGPLSDLGGVRGAPERHDLAADLIPELPSQARMCGGYVAELLLESGSPKRASIFVANS
jgi:hypothetical protein